MKFAKVLAVAALVAPSMASAQNNPPPPLVPTNFVFFAPAIIGFVALPVIFQNGNDTVAPVLPPAPIPTPSTRKG